MCFSAAGVVETRSAVVEREREILEDTAKRASTRESVSLWERVSTPGGVEALPPPRVRVSTSGPSLGVASTPPFGAITHLGDATFPPTDPGWIALSYHQLKIVIALPDE